jgi:phosphoenolpyruvate-protein kinase (PTS system EI component)
MSRLLQLSLMLLTTVLCSICVWQWHEGSRAAEKIRTLEAAWQQAGNTMQSQTLTRQRQEAEITRLNTALAAQTAALQEQAALQTKATAAAQSLDEHQKSLTDHQTLSETLRTQLKQALSERDALATRLNERTREFNLLTEKYRKAR